jgi:hypothetical protein
MEIALKLVIVWWFVDVVDFCLSCRGECGEVKNARA